jgi:cysteine desulfurase / selenocysteine lyase
MNIRKDFPIFERRNVIYLDSAATTQKPLCVIEAITQFYRENYGTVHRAIYQLAAEATASYNQVRAQVARFLNADPSEIIFTKGTTESLNLVAYSFGEAFVRPGDEIIISQTEHHANLVPWQRMCQAKRAVLKVIPVNDRAELILEAFEGLLSERTKLVSLAHISNVTGTHHPIEQIIAMAHARGAKVCIDGAQAAAHVPVDVKHLDADFYAFSGHKAFGPTGVGILYGKKELLEKMPPYQAGGDMIDKVTFAETTYQDPPLRFEAGTPMIAEVIGLGAAIAYIESLGRETIAAYEAELLAVATEQLEEIPGLRILGTAAKKGPIISFTIEGVHPLDLGTLLDTRGIACRTGNQCAQPTLQRFGLSAVTRVSFAPYNTFQDIHQFIHSLKEIRNLYFGFLS